ncbi:MAG: hypothetical protein F6K41_17405, partial [Symploca sp. SIO3E6]|nr:hypothetical protein [Caldora sp. SIO3E6]
TTFLYEYAENCGVNVFSPYDGGLYADDYGIWKHLRIPINPKDYPNVYVRPGYRVLYVVGNPYNSVCSLFRRGFHYWALERLTVPPEYSQKFNQDWSLADYLENGEDLFLLSDHVKNWTEKDYGQTYPIMVMKYEKMYQHKDVILDFMEIETRKRKFFEYWQRNSNYQSLPERQIELLKNIYGDLANYIDSLPDYFVR